MFYARRIVVVVMMLLPMASVWAHDPVFGLGPHTLFKGGYELHLGYDREKAGSEVEDEASLALKYGLTGDWVVGVELPYRRVSDGADSHGPGDIALSTKYRFWRMDSLGTQESAALLIGVNLDNGDDSARPALGNGALDWVAGLSYGYEGRRWYRWASIRHRFNGRSGTGLQAGDKTLLDLALGIRPRLNAYTEPDAVWMLELNGEYTRPASLNGLTLANSGGTEWFLAPGLMWTSRNFAFKSGLQVPVYSELNGRQESSDYRLKLELEWHL